MGLDIPTYGKQRVRVWENAIVVEESIETIQAAEDESPEAFILRVAREHQLGPCDVIEIHYQAGRPTIASIRR